jgi:hypothetical protein
VGLRKSASRFDEGTWRNKCQDRREDDSTAAGDPQRLVLETNAKEIELLSEAKDPKQLLESQLAANAKFLEIVRDTNELLRQCKETLRPGRHSNCRI